MKRKISIDIIYVYIIRICNRLYYCNILLCIIIVYILLSIELSMKYNLFLINVIELLSNGIINLLLTLHLAMLYYSIIYIL